MKRLSVFLLVVTLNVALGMTLRQKRQTNDDMTENTLDDKYGGYDQSDRWIWPNQERQPRPKPTTSKPMPTTQWLQPIQAGNLRQTTTPAPISNGSTTQTPRIQQCIGNCVVTTEYNPVCGTNLVQFNNIGRLECARSCGVDVTLLREGRCPPATTAAPTR